MRPYRLRIAVAAGGVLALAACGVPTGGAPSTIAASDIPYGLGSSAPPASATPTSAPDEEPAWIYLVDADQALVPRARATGSGDRAERLGALLDALAAGPTNQEQARRLSSVLPAGVQLSVADLADGVATVDIGGSARLPSGVEGRRAVAQIVLTATILPGVDAVRLTSDGEPVQAPLPSGELTDAPLVPADYAVFLTPPQPSTSPSSPTSEEQPFPADTRPDSAAASPGAAVTVTDVRAAPQDGFDRVVFEVAGTGIPGWDAQYVPEARSAGSGELIDLDGDAVLQVTLTGIGLPDDTGVEPYAGPDPLTAGGEAVREVALEGVFEGRSEAFVGVTAQLPFRVYLLQDPTRVVVEVLHR